MYYINLFVESYNVETGDRLTSRPFFCMYKAARYIDRLKRIIGGRAAELDADVLLRASMEYESMGEIVYKEYYIEKKENN